jgi:hypothetical protein
MKIIESIKDTLLGYTIVVCFGLYRGWSYFGKNAAHQRKQASASENQSKCDIQEATNE